jgi:membrane-bound inhibitor of C-type lysozyme
MSASGARYAADDLEFWNKGSEATLTEGDAVTVCQVDEEATAVEDAQQP